MLKNKILKNIFCLSLLLIGIVNVTAAVTETPHQDGVSSKYLWEQALAWFFGILSIVFSFLLNRVFKKFDDQDKKNESQDKDIKEMRDKSNKDFIENLNKINTETTMINKELTEIKLNYITKTDFHDAVGTIHKKLDEINEK